MSILGILERPQVIRAQLVFYLYSFKIYQQVKRMHAKARGLRRDEADQPYIELSKFPRQWPILRWYQVYTNVLYVYALLKYIHPSLLPNLLCQLLGTDQLSGLPIHCFLVGRFVAYPHLDGIVAILHSVAHLSFRYMIHRLNRPYRLDVIDFLSQQECHLRNYNHGYHQCHTHHNRSAPIQNRQHQRASSSSLQEISSASASNEWVHKFYLFHPFMCYEVPTSSGTSKIKGHHGGSGGVSKVLVLRPNRTLEAKRWIVHRMSRMATMLAIFLGSLSVVAVNLLAYETTFDSRHLLKYPDCDAELIQMIHQRHGDIPFEQVTSHTATRMHVILALCDFIESLSIWFESGIGITFVFMLPYILVQDLKLYWRKWNGKLVLLLQEARRDQATAVAHTASHGRRRRRRRFDGESFYSLPSKLVRDHYRGATAYDPRTANRAFLFDESIEELREEICDFFSQFQQAELVMRDIISASFVFWFVGIFGFGSTIARFYAQGHKIIGIPVHIVVPMFLTFFSVPLGLFSGCIFQLQGNCSQSYRTLHSLLAYIKPDAKEKYLKILEFFSEQKRHEFRFLLGHRFTPTVVVSIVSWTSSWLALFLSIIK